MGHFCYPFRVHLQASRRNTRIAQTNRQAGSNKFSGLKLMTTPNDTESASQFRSAEELVEKQSVVLRKELGLMDLVLTQILYIVGLSWVGVAAKLGPSHIVYWLAAIILFYAPSAAVVIYLNRLMPLEGG